MIRRRRRVVAFGNCQPRAVAELLERTPAFAARHDVTAFEVHKITAGQVEDVRAVFARADVVVTQAVGNDYHGLPVGSEQLLSACRRRVGVVRIPKLHVTAVFPFQIYYNGPTDVVRGHLHYGDLRAVALASGVHAPADPAGIRAHAAESDARLAAIEAETDVKIADRAFAPGRRETAMWTVDHPRRSTLDLIADGVLEHLGLPTGTPRDGVEPLGSIRAPLERPVVDALGLAGEAGTTWTTSQGPAEVDAVIAADAAMLAARPDVLETVQRWQADRLATLWPDEFG